MKIDTRKGSFRTLLPVLLGGALLLSSSCVSQARYDEAMAELRFYQVGLQDLESAMAPIEAENEYLKRQLANYEEVGTVESVATREIDARLEELRRMASGIGVAPGDVQVLQVEGGYGLRLADAVLFDSGKAEIKPEGQAIIASLAEQIVTNEYQRLWVRGHTDSDPVKRAATLERFPHGNLQLSVARAIEVAALLKKQPGIEGGKIVVAGFGPSLPVVANDSAENKKLNRRVEIFVIEDESAGAGR